MKKERMATFTVEIPVRFTFKASAKIDGDELINKAVNEAQKKLLFSDVDFKESDVAITKKIVHYTAEDIKAQNEFWAKVLGAKI